MNSGKVPYKIKFSRRRSIGIIVSPDGSVLVHAPYRTPESIIDKFVRSKTNWISRHLENYSGMIRLNNSAIFDGKTLLFKGMEYTLRINASTGNSVSLQENEIVINTRNPTQMSEVNTILEAWYKRMAVNQIASSVDEILNRYGEYGFCLSAVSVRAMKRRWGSCSTKGKITINSELIKLDEKYLHYVILHELCHLLHHNHSREYYNLLTEVSPGWKEIRKALRRYIA